MVWNPITNLQGPHGPVEQCWPKKSVYLTKSNKNPNELLGFGTWEYLFEDRNIKYWKRTA